jgi:homocysteine S-methyltransferase
MPDPVRLPQLAGGRPFVTDGGLETTLIFHRGLDLPLFAAFTLLRDEDGRDALRDYFAPYLAIARDRDAGMVIDTPTWRANPDWGARLGYSPGGLDDANRRAVALAQEVRGASGLGPDRGVVSGAIGPRGDGYVVGDTMAPDAAEAYHAVQIGSFASAGADMVTAYTMTYADEAIGVVRAATAAGMPAAIAFTVETDGRLPSGEDLGAAIERVDAETGAAAAYFMINCAHPTHFAPTLEEGGAWRERIGGLRANASMRSHAELDEADDLDDGDPADLGSRHRDLRPLLPNVRVLGGCCGTDHRHVAEVSAAWG